MIEEQQQGIRLQAWLRLLREGGPAGENADALCRYVRACPGVQQAYWLGWQERGRIYAHEGRGPDLPPGQGDPLQASDLALYRALQRRRYLSLEQAREQPCWLAGRLRRAGLAHGGLLPLAQPRPGILLVAMVPGADPAWLPELGVLLHSLLAQLPRMAASSPLLNADPQAAIEFEPDATPRALNAAMQRLLGERPLTEVAALLPVNYRQLVSACLGQGRAIGEVEAQVGERILLWQFIPEPAERRVLARCRDATEELTASREAAVATRLYRLITENTTDLISRHTPDGRFLDASPASWVLLGYWPEQLRGQPVQPLLHPRDRALQLRRAGEALARDGYLTLTYRVRHSQGHYLWFETACRAIRETYTGAVVEVVCVSRDITARVQAEENNRRLAEVVKANTDLVLFIDPEGRLTSVNPSGRRALGLEEGGALPALAALMSGEDFARLQRQGWAAAERDGAWTAEARLLPRGGGAALTVSLVLLAHKGAGGQYYFSLVARDMTERELREAQQRRHQDELAHTARLVTLGELASGIAHEINQPLAAVVNYAGASLRYLNGMADNPGALDKVAEGLHRITGHARHAAEVISRLRGFLRKGQRRMQALDMEEVVREAIDFCAWEAARHRITIVPQLAPALPVVYGDPVLLEQVLLNLLRNAIEANRERHPDADSRIRLRVEAEPERLLLRVSDQGPGVGPEQRARLFTPFYTSKADGLGLGLSMSRSIVEGFGGGLDLEPNGSEGATFYCWLPRRPEDGAGNAIAGEQRTGGQ